MRKNLIRNVVIHVTENFDRAALAREVCKFHVTVIKRRIDQSSLTPNQRNLLTDRIMEESRAKYMAASDT